MRTSADSTEKKKDTDSGREFAVLRRKTKNSHFLELAADGEHTGLKTNECTAEMKTGEKCVSVLAGQSL